MRLAPPGSFVAVDWGTSSLRLWLTGPDGTVLAETRSAEGMGSLDPAGFEAVLRVRLGDLGFEAASLSEPVPVILCGMVGARQGWREAPYAEVPTALSNIPARAISVAAEGLDARILPGLCRRDPGRPDVMRGEETQLLGLVLDDPALSATVCMPGTHSKWVRLESGRVADFSTVLTGELFALMSRQSILRHTIGEASPSGDPEAADFRRGVEDALADPAGILGRLFPLRAENLLFGLAGTAAADRLSGLLLGAEIAPSVRNTGPEPIVLVASGRLAGLYGAALRVAGRDFRLVDADDAVRAGLLHAARSLWPAVSERASS